MGYEAMIEKLGLTVPDLQLPEGMKPVAWGQNANTWAFFFDNPDADALVAALEQVRSFVNAQYRIPRPLRLFAPYMVVVAVLDTPSRSVDAVVAGSYSSGAWGGEIYHLVAVTRSTGAVVRLAPRGTQNQRYVESLRLRSKKPELYGEAALLVEG